MRGWILANENEKKALREERREQRQQRSGQICGIWILASHEDDESRPLNRGKFLQPRLHGPAHRLHRIRLRRDTSFRRRRVRSACE